jgi:hypothetical protein
MGLWRHVKNCPSKISSSQKNTVQHDANMMIEGALYKQGSSVLHDRVLSKMKIDQVSIATKNDPLICAFGTSLIEAGNDVDAQYVSQRMRQLGRLLIILRSRNSEEAQLKDFLRPTMFDKVVEATRSICCYDGDIMTPSLALKLGHSMKDCVGIRLGQIYRVEEAIDLQEKVKLENFRDLYENEWCRKVSKRA